MVTDDERREVAERLREYGARPYPNFNIALILCAMGIDLIEHLERRHGDSELFDRLADLIDPGDTVKCVAEVKVDGEQLEKLVHEAVAEYAGVNRVAILETLDEMSLTVRCAGPDVERAYVERWVDEIREALGVTEDE